LYSSANLTGLGTILSLPATNGSYATSVAPTGWSLSQNTPDIMTFVDGQLLGGGYLIASSISGTSIDGGSAVAVWSRTYNVNEYESIRSSALTTVVGQTYTVAVEWQKFLALIAGNVSGGGSMFISDGTTRQLYSKTLSANNDSWDVVTYTFTAKSTSTLIEIGANYLGTENETGNIAFDVLSAAQFTNYKTTAATGATVASVMSTAAVSDVDTGATVQGYAFTSAAASSTYRWEFSSNNGTTWTTMTPASVSNAIFLKGTDLIRWTGTTANDTDLKAVVVDNTGPNAASGTAINVSTRGGTTAFSANEVVLASASTTPVVLDLNQDGVLSYGQVQMDMNADGVLDTTAWAGGQDGVLVHDTFGDGSVRSTSQFAFARHGGETDLQGLAESFDSNRDGVLNKLDMAYDKFAVWQDANQNGQADAGEVKHLIALDITEIQLHTDGIVSTPAAGVTVAGLSTATLSTGTSMLVADAAFEYTLGTAGATVIPVSEPGSSATTVIQLDTSTWQNKPYALSEDQLAELNLPAPEETTATLNLSHLLGAEAAPCAMPQAGAPVHMGIDPMLQVMIDNQLNQMVAA
jgi:hypothetical protein